MKKDVGILLLIISVFVFLIGNSVVKTGNRYEENYIPLPNTKPVYNAFIFYRRIMLAEMGNTNAQNNLGVMYHNGEGVERDYNKAIYWYQRAAEHGHKVAQCNLGVIYRNTPAIEKDYKKAFFWFSESAKQGYRDAQLNLGVMYKYGEYVEQDYKKATHWFSEAAYPSCSYSHNADCPLHYPLAVNALAFMQEKGFGTEQSNQYMFENYFDSAEDGCANSQYKIGLIYLEPPNNIYENEVAISQSNRKAYIWFSLASLQGHAQATEMKNKLKPILTEEEHRHAEAGIKEQLKALQRKNNIHLVQSDCLF
jgi:TPR repeat protein